MLSRSNSAELGKRARLGAFRTRLYVVGVWVILMLTLGPAWQFLVLAVMFLWWGLDAAPEVEARLPVLLPPWVKLGVMLMPFVVLWSAYFGLSDAQSATSAKGTVKPSVIELKGKSPERQAILLRVLALLRIDPYRIAGRSPPLFRGCAERSDWQIFPKRLRAATLSDLFLG